ncbi:MAG: TlpA family protein disulfide reductase [Bacteroidales bacterium]|nr:TlpA family protein disulfide reductase [Bacteroidales bacterium]
MKKYRPYFMIIFILLLFSSCGQEKPGKGETLIIGNYFSSDSKLYLTRVYAANIETIDSVDLASDTAFTITLDSPDYALFRLENNDLYPLIVVAKNGDTVKIEQTNDKAWPYHIQGNTECMLVANFLEKLNREEYKVDSLSAIFHNSQSLPDFPAIRERLNEEFIIIHNAFKEYAKSTVTMYPSSLAAIVIINGFFREFLLFDQRKDFNYYEIVDKALMERMPENKYAKDFHIQVENIKASIEYEEKAKQRLSAGRLVPEFELYAINGEKTGPQNYKGRLLLIYFWAASDAKSRQTNPVIKKTYDNYHQQGLELLTISFDTDQKIWRAAIELDSLPGLHIDDMDGVRSPLQKLFNLKMQLPAYFLIDTKGRIVHHDRDFRELPQKVVDLIHSTLQF